MRRAMTSIFMTQISSWCIHGIISNVIRALDVNRRADRTRLGVELDCPKYDYKFRTSEATTLKGGSLTRSLYLARYGEQPRDVGDIGQSNVA